MLKYLILIATVFLMVGCPATEKYKAEQQAAYYERDACGTETKGNDKW